MKKQNLFLLLKITIAIVSICYIVYRLISLDIKNVFSLSDFTKINKLLYFTFASILIYINWSLESLKWKFLLRNIQPITFTISLKAILIGISVSIFTPNRIGEFGGRILLLHKKNRASAVYSTVVGNLSQLLATVIFGSFSLLIFLAKEILPLGQYSIGISIILLLIISILTIFFISIDRFSSYLLSIKAFRFIEKYKSAISNYSKLDLLKTFIISSIRYFVILIQYVLLLNFFDVSITTYNAMLSISSIYLILAIVPTIALSEIGVRGSIAIYILSFFSQNIAGILAATLLIWFLNLVIPAIFGYYFLLKKQS